MQKHPINMKTIGILRKVSKIRQQAHGATKKEAMNS